MKERSKDFTQTILVSSMMMARCYSMVSVRGPKESIFYPKLKKIKTNRPFNKRLKSLTIVISKRFLISSRTSLKKLTSSIKL